MFSEPTRPRDVVTTQKRLEDCPYVDLAHVREKCLCLYELVFHGYPNPPDHLQNGYKMLPIGEERAENCAPQIFAIDCEMVTTRSIDGVVRQELARVSVVNHNLDVIIDALVKPKHEIIDYLTTYSGLTQTIMENAELELDKIQEIFLELFDRSVIFVGHSLEQDLHALEIIHMNVIDTSVLYLRDFGGAKPKLKYLAAKNLNMLIQLGPGHNSTEDARCAMMLALRRLLTPEEFVKYSQRGSYSQNFFKEHEKFLQIKVYPPGDCMSWMSPLSQHLKHFTERCQLLANKENTPLTFKLCPFYFYIPPKQTHGRLAVAFYIGLYSSTVYKYFEYQDEFNILRNICNVQMSLKMACRIVYKNRLPQWTFQPQYLHQPKPHSEHSSDHHRQHHQHQPHYKLQAMSQQNHEYYLRQSHYQSQHFVNDQQQSSMIMEENNSSQDVGDNNGKEEICSTSLSDPSTLIDMMDPLEGFREPAYRKSCSNSSTSSGTTGDTEDILSCASESSDVSLLLTPTMIETPLEIDPPPLAIDKKPIHEIKTKKMYKQNNGNRSLSPKSKMNNHQPNENKNRMKRKFYSDRNKNMKLKAGKNIDSSSQNMKPTNNIETKNQDQKQRNKPYKRHRRGRRKYRDRKKRRNKRKKNNENQEKPVVSA